MEKESIIQSKTFDFIKDIFIFVKCLPKNTINDIIIKQLIRSVTSIGANIEEALGAASKKEFIHCMNISKKEARESRYWLKIILLNNPNLEEKIKHLELKNLEIINILTKIVKTSKQNNL